jgi:hypothetical protein
MRSLRVGSMLIALSVLTLVAWPDKVEIEKYRQIDIIVGDFLEFAQALRTQAR